MTTPLTNTLTIDQFNTAVINNRLLLDPIEALRADILSLVSNPSTFEYSPRNNYTLQLPPYLTDMVLGEIPHQHMACFISVVKENSAIPFHNDGVPRLGANIPLQNCQDVTFAHADGPIDPEFITEITGSNPDGSTYAYDLIKDHIVSYSDEVSFLTPMLLNIHKFHTAINDSDAPAIFLSIRFMNDVEEDVYAMLQNA